MNLREIECFLAVARELHFARAAERLHLAQPTVSESVQRLERKLGGQLFDRTTRNVRLTEFGASFREVAEAAYTQMEQAYATGRQLARRSNRSMLIGYCPGDEPALLSVLSDLSRRFPESDVEFVEMSTARQVDAILDGSINAGLAWEPLPHEAIETHVFARVGYVAIVPVTHPLAQRPAVPAATLASEPLLTSPAGANPGLYQRFAAAMDATGRSWSLVGTASGLANMVSRVVSGHGVGMLLATAIGTRPLRGVAFVPVENGPVAERSVIWSRNQPHHVLPDLIDSVRQVLHHDADELYAAVGT